MFDSSNNPALAKMPAPGAVTGESMSIRGTINATVILAVIVFTAAIWGYQSIFTDDGLVEFKWYHIGSTIFAFVLAIVISFKQNLARMLSPVYAAAQGVFLGAISGFFELQYPGIAIQAVLATMGVLFALLFAYKAGLIKPTQKFKSVIIAATGGIAIFYLISIVFSFFGANLNFLRDSSPLSIGISLVITVVAALNLILDFDAIEKAASRGYPKHYNWYGAFSLMVTLVWLYLEILKLFAKLKDR